MAGTIHFGNGGRAYRNGKELQLPAKPACAHSIDALRFDGFWHADGELRAQVTCCARGCNRSFTLPVREDVAARHLAARIGGEGPASAETTHDANDGHGAA